MKKLDFPINRCTIDLTENCNLRCGYCFTFFNKDYKRKNLSLKTGTEIIDWIFKDEISQSDTIDLNWWGGEPFVKFDLMKQLTDYALNKSSKTGKRLSVGGTSNVTLWTPEIVDWMDKHRAYFMMSIDGPKDIQDLNRPCAVKGESSWDMIEKNLPYIMKKIPFIGSRMSPTPQHVHRMSETFKMLYEKYNIKSQMFSPVHELEWTKEKLEEAKRQLMIISDMIIEKRLKGQRFDVKHLDDGARIIESGKQHAEFPCGAGRFYVGISTRGMIYPCHRFNKYNNGSDKNATLIGNIYDGITNPEFRNKFINWHSNPFPEKCTKDCELYGNLCDMACYAVSYDLTGSIYKPPKVYCDWQHMFAEVAKYYHKKLKENNLPIPGMNMGGNMNNSSCVCNNMCYQENISGKEIINADPNTDASCICNNMSYNGGLDDQARKLTDKERQELLGKKVAQVKQMSISPEGNVLLNQLMEKMDRDKELQLKLIELISELTKQIKKD